MTGTMIIPILALFLCSAEENTSEVSNMRAENLAHMQNSLNDYSNVESQATIDEGTRFSRKRASKRGIQKPPQGKHALSSQYRSQSQSKSLSHHNHSSSHSSSCRGRREDCCGDVHGVCTYYPRRNRSGIIAGVVTAAILVMLAGILFVCIRKYGFPERFARRNERDYP